MDSINHKARIHVFGDAGRVADHGELSIAGDLLIDHLGKNAHFHTLVWMSHESRRHSKSTGAAEVLAAGNAIDEGNVL